MNDIAKPPATSLRPSREQALEAVRTLIRWAGDDPQREGLLGTPDRVVRAYGEFFSGYGEDPVALLHRTFEEISGYDEIVLLKDIRFESHCEHHIAPSQHSTTMTAMSTPNCSPPKSKLIYQVMARNDQPILFGTDFSTYSVGRLMR